MTPARHHAEWLSLVESSGPFLSMPVLLRAFPQGLDLRDATRPAALRENYEDWLERGRPLLHVHTAWIRHVLENLLEWPADFIASSHAELGLSAPGNAEPQLGAHVSYGPPPLTRGDSKAKNTRRSVHHPPEEEERPGGSTAFKKTLNRGSVNSIWKNTFGATQSQTTHRRRPLIDPPTQRQKWVSRLFHRRRPAYETTTQAATPPL